MTTNYTGKTCAGCSRSIWECPQEQGPDCRAHATAPKIKRCSPAEHTALLIRKPSRALYLGMDGDDVVLACPRCEEPLFIDAEYAVAVSAPMRVVRRRPDDEVTQVRKAPTMDELANEARTRLGL